MQDGTSWRPALAGMLCLGLGAGLIGVYGFFVPALSQQFGVGAAVLNTGPVALLLVPGFVAPLVGRLTDRMPIRGLVLAGATLAMLALLAISRAPSLAVAGLGFLFFALGMTGYGPVVINGLMVKLYPGREARALAITAMGISLASAVLPPVVAQLLAQLGWRDALASLAAVVLVLLWAAALAGLPAGIVGDVAGRGVAAARGFYRQRAFWLIGLCVALGFNVAIVLAVCYPPHFTGAGYSVAQAGLFLSCAGLAGFFGKFCIALLGDAGRDHARWLAAGILLLQACGLGLLLAADRPADVYGALLLTGFGGVEIAAVQVRMHGQEGAAIIGQVGGAQMPLFLPFGLVGAPLAGYAFDRTGNYELVLVVLAAVLVMAALLAAALPAGRRSDA